MPGEPEYDSRGLDEFERWERSCPLPPEPTPVLACYLPRAVARRLFLRRTVPSVRGESLN